VVLLTGYLIYIKIINRFNVNHEGSLALKLLKFFKSNQEG